MLVRIRQFFNAYLTVDSDESCVSPQQAIQLATAALLIEVSRADFELDDNERSAVLDTLRRTFDLDAVTLDNLIKLAEEELDDAASLYQFTRLVNDYYSYEQKLELIGLMWKVAFADGSIDKYEEHLIRKVAELVYVAHNDFIRLKLAAGTHQLEL